MNLYVAYITRHRLKVIDIKRLDPISHGFRDLFKFYSKNFVRAISHRSETFDFEHLRLDMST